LIGQLEIRRLISRRETCHVFLPIFNLQDVRKSFCFEHIHPSQLLAKDLSDSALGQIIHEFKVLGNFVPGQFLLAEITLPETEANELKRILETDPHIMRAIIESVMKKRLITSNPDAWDQPYKMGDPLRPPYEKWDAELNDEEILILTEPDMSEF